MTTSHAGDARVTIWVLGDQLSMRNSSFDGACPDTHRVLLVESVAKLTEQRWHVQRAHFMLASLRRFADVVTRLLISYAVSAPDDPPEVVAHFLSTFLVHGAVASGTNLEAHP
jgi:deoxyribodipyrimidine photolyase-like uncharacterized protein